MEARLGFMDEAIEWRDAWRFLTRQVRFGFAEGCGPPAARPTRRMTKLRGSGRDFAGNDLRMHPHLPVRAIVVRSWLPVGMPRSADGMRVAWRQQQRRQWSSCIGAVMRA